MKTILLLVTSSPTSSANCLSALAFAKAAVQSHKVVVFFYGEGIHNANSYMQPPGDELNVYRAWQALAERHQVELIVCATAAVKRGVIAVDEAALKNAFNLQAPFHPGGLAEFAQASQTCDHMIQF